MHRVPPQSGVFAPNSFRSFNALIEKYEASDFIIIDLYGMELQEKLR